MTRTPLLLLALALTTPVAAQAPPPAPFAGLQFLVGKWQAVSSGGKPGEARSGGFELAYELGRNVLVRRNRAEYAPKPGSSEPVVHEDLMVIHHDAGAVRAMYYDNEGHIIRYAVRFPAAQQAVFESEGDKGPRFRLSYQLGPDGQLSIEFAVAGPGADFKPYVTARAKRAT